MKRFNFIFSVITCLIAFVYPTSVRAAEQAVEPGIFPPNVVAFVNGEALKDVDLRDRLKTKYDSVDQVTDDSVNDALNELINFRLIVQEAYSMSLDKDPIIVNDTKNYIRIQSIIRFRTDFYRGVTVGEKEVSDIIKLSYERRKVELLFSEDEEKAKRLFSLVEQGRPLEDFKDEASYWTGVINRKTYGESSAATETIYSSKVGETIFVKSEKGFLIVKILGKVLLPPERKSRIVANIKKQLINKKGEQAIADFLKEQREKAVIEIDSDLIRKLDPEQLLKEEDWANDTRVIAKINGEDITVGVFLKKYKSYLRPHQQMGKAANNEEQNNKTMEVVINTTIESQAALARNYYAKSAYFQESVQKHKERVMRRLFFRKMIHPKIELTRDNLEKYYNDNIKLFSYPDEVALKGIFVRDKSKAVKYLKELRKGASVSFLYDNFSLKHPYNGWKLITDLPKPIAEGIRRLEVGDISDPIFIDNAYMVIKLVGRKEGKPIPFQTALKSVQSRYIRDRGDKILAGLTEKLRENSEIIINTSLLTDIEKLMQE